jgi:molybdopterin-guanine dinucleotide biosynthesis protein MobB
MTNKMRFIGIVGHKKSGKTTLIELLTAELSARGFIIGTIKMTTHDLQFDSPGKDTHRHRAAGSLATLIKSSSEHAFFAAPQYLDDILISQLFSKCDFVFIEGDSGSDNPKICVSDNRGIRDDVTGEIIAVWGQKIENSEARHFMKEQIPQLAECIIENYHGKE